MINISYNVKGADAIIRTLDGIRLDAIKGDVATLMDAIAADAADYPPELPNQRYVRTGDLGRGWTDSAPLMRGDATSLLAVLTNSVSYGPEVMSAEDQRAIFAGRWRTTDQITDAWEDRAAQAIEAALGRLVGA
jgi:hypothetical protein